MNPTEKLEGLAPGHNGAEVKYSEASSEKCIIMALQDQVPPSPSSPQPEVYGCQQRHYPHPGHLSTLITISKAWMDFQSLLLSLFYSLNIHRYNVITRKRSFQEMFGKGQQNSTAFSVKHLSLVPNIQMVARER